MSELLYVTDSYLQTFEAVVTEQVEGGVVLDRTAFYPGGGGQPCDFGMLTAGDQNWEVTKVAKVNGRPVHFIAGELPEVGTAQPKRPRRCSPASIA
jgi:misacylated tRNA(Ala) deacylase